MQVASVIQAEINRTLDVANKRVARLRAVSDVAAFLVAHFGEPSDVSSDCEMIRWTAYRWDGRKRSDSHGSVDVELHVTPMRGVYVVMFTYGMYHLPPTDKDQANKRRELALADEWRPQLKRWVLSVKKALRERKSKYGGELL